PRTAPPRRGNYPRSRRRRWPRILGDFSCSAASPFTPSWTCQNRYCLALRTITSRTLACRSRSPRATRSKRDLRLFRRLACVIGRKAFDDRIAVGQAHVVHHGISAPVVAIGPQRQYQIVLVLPIDDWDRQRRIVLAPGMATIALVGRHLEQ